MKGKSEEKERLKKRYNIMEFIQPVEMFKSLGLSAGITLRSDWGDQSGIYDFIAEFLPDHKNEIVAPRQTHSAQIAWLDKESNQSNIKADGTISESSGLCLTIRTADCMPLLFADKSGLFGAVHVGWRGLVSGILDELFIKIRERGHLAENISVYLGPSIRNCCFEVGDDVAALFRDDFVINRDGRFYVDLPKAAGNIIAGYGVKDANVEISSECTCCGGERFYSYRRDGLAPLQMVSYIYKS